MNFTFNTLVAICLNFLMVDLKKIQIRLFLAEKYCRREKGRMLWTDE